MEKRLVYRKVEYLELLMASLMGHSLGERKKKQRQTSSYTDPQACETAYRSQLHYCTFGLALLDVATSVAVVARKDHCHQ